MSGKIARTAGVSVALVTMFALPLVQAQVPSLIYSAEALDVDMDYSDEKIIVATGTRGYVGCTILSDGREIDLPAQRAAGVATFSVPYDLPSGTYTAVVSLWRRLVRDCGCEYCRRNGYHMEGRLDTKRVKVHVH